MRNDRRDFLKQFGSGIALAALAPLGSLILPKKSAQAADSISFSRPKVGIIGGGIGGVSTAWMLDQAADVHLFESSDQIGGHAMTRSLQYGGETFAVDVGAQYFSPISYPGYIQLLEKVGLYLPNDPDRSSTMQIETTLTVFDQAHAHPSFVAPHPKDRLWPIFDPLNFVGLNAFDVSLSHAKKLTAQGDWSVTLGDWIESLPLSPHQKNDILYPYLVAAIGCDKASGAGLSALSVLFYVTQSLGGGLIPSPVYLNSKIGLQGNVNVIAKSCTSLSVHTQSTITNIAALGNGYRLTLQDGSTMDFDHIVMACPPAVSRELLVGLPQMQEQVAALNQFQTFPARIVIHTDPIYVPKQKKFWSSVNTEANDIKSESSMWFGAMRPKLANGKTVDIFKSWASNRSQESKEILIDQSFHHFLTSTQMVEATHTMSALQGKNKVWFAGAYMGGPVNHETAVQSAIQVARGLAPDSARLSGF